MDNVINQKPKVTVIIPSLDGSRGGNVNKLKKDLNSQTLRPYEIIVVVGVSPNGRARNTGVERAKKDTDFYVFIDDDTILGNEKVIESLVSPFYNHDADRGDWTLSSKEDRASSVNKKPVGMTGPSQLIPEDSNWIQRMAARQVPRSLMPVQEKLIDSDMVSHMCLCIPAELFRDLGMEHPDIISGTDPDLRYRVREAGYRICVVPHSWAYHPMPPTIPELMKRFYNKGKNSATVRKEYPDLVFEVGEKYKKEFKPKRPLLYRSLRLNFRLFFLAISFQWLGLAAMTSYTVGNIVESLKRTREP